MYKNHSFSSFHFYGFAFQNKKRNRVFFMVLNGKKCGKNPKRALAWIINRFNVDWEDCWVKNMILNSLFMETVELKLSDFPLQPFPDCETVSDGWSFWTSLKFLLMNQSVNNNEKYYLSSSVHWKTYEQDRLYQFAYF